MSLLHKYLEKTDFVDLADFQQNLSLNIPENFHFARDVIDVYAATEPERRALVWCNDNGDEQVFTFAEIAKMSQQAAHVFTSYGVKKGDGVMLICKGRWQFWIALIGLSRIGAIAVPATHMVQARDIAYRLSKIDFKCIVSVKDERLNKYLAEESAKYPGIALTCIEGETPGWHDFNADLAKQPTEYAFATGEDAINSFDTMLVYFSSGTTGMPKMIAHDYFYPLAHIMTAKYWQNCIDGGLHYTVADTGWAKCVWGKIYGQWIAGSAVFSHDYEQFKASDMLNKIAQYGVTTFCAPPTVYRFLIREDLSQYDFSKLKYAVVAGEPLNPEVFRLFKEKTGLELREAFGQTEATVIIGTWPWMTPKPGSMGIANPIYDVALIDANDQLVDPGQQGEIAVKAKENDLTHRPPGLFIGYRSDPEKTAQAWFNGWYRTGDLAWKDEDGYIWFIGRSDDVIKTSGYKVGPFEVESALMQHPAVLECAITGTPDPEGIRGDVVKATVVLTPDYRPGSAELVKELQDHIKRVTEPYKYPRVVEFVDVLPKTISGKIRRVDIRHHDHGQPEN